MILGKTGHRDEVKDLEAQSPQVLFQKVEGADSSATAPTRRGDADDRFTSKGFKLKGLTAPETIQQPLRGFTEIMEVDGSGEDEGVGRRHLRPEGLEAVLLDTPVLRAAAAPPHPAGEAGEG